MKNSTILEYQKFDEDLPSLLPLPITCSDTTYISKLTNYVFDMIKDTIFNPNNLFISPLSNEKPIKSYINKKKKRNMVQTLNYTLSYIRAAEHNDYKMNLAIGFGSSFYTKSSFSRTYFLPIIREMITIGLLEIGTNGSHDNHTVTIIQSSKKLINIFNIFEKQIIKEICFIIEDNSEYIEIRKDKNCKKDKKINEDTTIENWAKINGIHVFDRDISLTLKNDNWMYSKLLEKTKLGKKNEYLFSYNYHEKLLKSMHEYYKTCIFGYNRTIEIKYNKELKIKFEYLNSKILNSITKKNVLKGMVPKICINRFRIKPCRIFSNSSLTIGGRFYNMFLTEMPKCIRQTVTINNQKTTCIDFNAMHPSLLYYFIFGQFPNNSIYKNIKSEKTDKFKIDNNLLTAIIKMAIVISLNTKSPKSAIVALTTKLKKIVLLSSDKYEFEKLKIPKKYHSFILSKSFLLMIFEKIHNKLNWLHPFLFVDIGQELVFIESLVFIKTAEIFYDKTLEFPISIHDGYVVKKVHTQILTDSIHKSCNSLFGSVIPYKIEY